MSGFRSSPFRLTETLAFRVVGCDFRHLAAVLRLPDFRVSHIYAIAKRKHRKSCALHLFSHMGSGSPALAIVSGSIAFILIHEFSFLGFVALKSFRLTISLVPEETAACYTPRPVSLSDKPQNDRLPPPILSLLLLSALVLARYFYPPLAKGGISISPRR